LEYEKLLKLLGEDGKFDLVLWGRWWPYRFSFPGQAVLQERDKWYLPIILSLKVCFE
jgi:hypothetical protein